VAHRFGYLDHMHTVHEFAEFTGLTLAALQSDPGPEDALRVTRLII
jgi:hypothetical protein